MASRKEDEKNERIIRALLKLPSNRKCINCNSLGPQYVCTTFWTFICTPCSGIHREFTHRVKSVSMAKFTPQEVSSLQSGGNERAKEIYFKELDPRQVPDSSNVDRLRDFIKHVYVNRRYTGERSTDKPSVPKMGDKEEPSDYKRTDSYGSGSSRSPPYDSNERRYSDRPSPGYEGRRSPGYDQSSQRSSDYGRSPVQTGSPVVNDWRREDRFGNGRRSEDLRSSEGDSKLGSRSPDSQKDVSISSPPTIRPVREILGESAPPLRVIEPPKVASSRIHEASAQTQRTASSSSLASSNGNPSEIKRESSLIDFFADPEPPTTVATQPNQSVANVSSTINSDNWACFDNAPVVNVSQPPPNLNVSQPPPNLNAMDSLLTQLSVPSSASTSGYPSAVTPPNSTTPAVLGDSLFASPAALSGEPASNASLVASNGAYSAAPSNPGLPPSGASTFMDAFSSMPSGGALPAITGPASTLSANGVAGQWSNMQHQQQSTYPGSGSQHTVSQFTPSFAGASTSQGLSSQPAPSSSGVAAQSVELKASGRKELPADIFAAMYAPQPVHAYGWQTGYPTGMAYPMQYATPMPMPTYSQQAKSFNPFDISSESRAQAPVFPSMMPLQNALPNMANPTGLMRTSSLDTALPSWIPSQTPAYPSPAPQMTPSFANTFAAQGPYMNQQMPSNLAPRPQGFGGFGNDVTSFSSANATLDFGGNSSAPAAPSSSGNPFG